MSQQETPAAPAVPVVHITEEGVIVPAAQADEFSKFLVGHVSGRTDRQLLIAAFWHGRQAREEIAGLRALVESIENEANQAMAGLTDPSKMMDMARNFLGS